MTVDQLRPVLTMQAMEGDTWEPALSYPLPENPSLELLEEARAQVLTYLYFASSDIASGGDDAETRKEINRAAVRLTEIALLLPFAVTSTVDEQLAKERDERLREWAEQRGLRPVSGRDDPKPGC